MQWMIAVTLLVLLQVGGSFQHPNFLGTAIGYTSTSEFKGLPRLEEIDEAAGERRVVYYHDQIVGIIDVLDRRKLLRCELIEVYEPSEAKEILSNVTTTMSLKPHVISFENMTKLMNMCDKLDENPARSLPVSNESSEKSFSRNPLFLGIVPGTKWCGTGDIAKSYHDLGPRTKIDRCCRAHDLCPVKVRAYKTRYNLVNNSFYSKSHCTCDETFYKCLKSVNHVSANIIGNIYFNIAQPPCIQDEPSTADGLTPKKFVSIKRAF